jgi:hypothetical protein
MKKHQNRIGAIYGSIAVLSLVLSAFFAGACEEFECGYGGPGCSAPIVAGLCEDVLVAGQEYILIFGYGFDTGVSEATITSVESSDPHLLLAEPTAGAPDVPYETGPTGPFDLNNGKGDGGMTLRPLLPGEVEVTVVLQYWEQPQTLSFRVVDQVNAPDGFMAMSAKERLAKCIEMTTTTGQ